MEYHQWRTFIPDDLSEEDNPIRNLGTDYSAYCRLCRLVREKQRLKQKQYYKSVTFLLFHTNMIFNTLV